MDSPVHPKDTPPQRTAGPFLLWSTPEGTDEGAAESVSPSEHPTRERCLPTIPSPLTLWAGLTLRLGSLGPLPTAAWPSHTSASVCSMSHGTVTGRRDPRFESSWPGNLITPCGQVAPGPSQGQVPLWAGR